MLEVCVENVQSALSACNGGASRLELCSCLALGGLTPSVGLFKTVRKNIPSNIPIFVMIRPKPGEDYVYDEHDLQIMLEDISTFKEIGADGFVFGCLNESKNIDVKACEKLLESTKGFPSTFHRAFDVVQNPEESLKTLMRLGFSRILTSGQEKNAFLGRNLIKKLVLKVKELDSELLIMPGGGVDESNLREILDSTNAKEFHGSGRRKSEKEEKVWVTDESVVREMIRIAEEFKY